MPRVEQLPEDLKELAYRNAVELTHPRWKSDVQVLIRALQPFMDEPSGSSADGEKGPGEGPPATQASEHENKVAAVASTIDPQTMDRISKALAAYIGPIAEVFVRRAAKRCSSTKELCAMVAQEIEFESDRVRFLRSCQN